MTKRTKTNAGEVPQYHVENNREAVIAPHMCCRITTSADNFRIELVLRYSVFCGKLQKSFATQIDFMRTLAYDKFDYLCPA